MDYTAEWSDRSIRDFRSILLYVDERNEFATKRVRKHIIDRIRLLESSPRLGSLFQIANHGEVRDTRAGSFRIFYIVLDETKSIRILTIRHVKWEDPDFSE